MDASSLQTKSAVECTSPRLWLICSFALVALHAGVAAEQSSPSSLDSYLKKLRYEPIELKLGYFNQMFAHGTFGSGKKRAFLVDTGWGITTLDEGSARGLKPLGEMGAALEDKVLGHLTNSSLVIMEKLVLDHAQFLHQPALVKKLRADFIHLSFDGVLGCDFLFRNFCLVDCAARRLYVRSSEPSEQESRAMEQSFLRSGFSAVPIRLKDLLTIDAEVNGQPIELGVDTGADYSLIDQSQMSRLSLVAIKEDEPQLGTMIRGNLSSKVVGVGNIGAHTMRVTTVNNLRLGSREWRGVHFGLADLKAWSGPHERLQGLLGGDLLSGRGALIDFAGGKLWFSPEKNESHR